jgi:hypothetical protein
MVIVAKDALWDSDYQKYYVHVAVGTLQNLVLTAWGRTQAEAKERARIIVQALSIKQLQADLN